MNLKKRTLAIIGLGYVGLPLAVEFGKRRSVIGFDIKADRISELQSGRDHTLEVTEDELKQAKFLTFTADAGSIRSAIEQEMVFIVTVPTPVDRVNRPDLTPLIKASETVGRVLKAGDVVIYESTVYPGATEEVCVPILERESGLVFNRDFYAAYSPERINPGDKTHRLPDIKKVTSGSTPEAAQAVDELYKEIIIAGTHLASSIKVAEAAKVIENAQRDLNIAFVNELSVIFARMGIDTTEVLTAAATKWNFLPFKPGLVGGHCIGIDPYYLTHKAEMLGYHPQVILAGRRINDSMASYVVQQTVKQMISACGSIKGAKVIVLGLTFKENCPDLRNSKVANIVLELKEYGCEVFVYDPVAELTEAREEYGIELTSWAALPLGDAIVAAVPHREFVAASLDEILLKLKPGGVFVDVKSAFDAENIRSRGVALWRL
ncbi:MAG: nucleotide sugar dehydrogenase [Burkholderiaceae bacterium]